MEPKFSTPEMNASIPERSPDAAPQLPSQEMAPEVPPFSPERSPSSAPERAPEQAVQAQAGISAQPVPITLPTPVPLPTDEPVSTSTDDTPAVAADEDLIEKEWVDKAKRIISETRDDPAAREKQVNRLQADYLRKRYGKELGASAE